MVDRPAGVRDARQGDGRSDETHGKGHVIADVARRNQDTGW